MGVEEMLYFETKKTKEEIEDTGSHREKTGTFVLSGVVVTLMSTLCWNSKPQEFKCGRLQTTQFTFYISVMKPTLD